MQRFTTLHLHFRAIARNRSIREADYLALSRGNVKYFYKSVTLQQAASLFQVRPDNAQKSFKTLIGDGSRFVKIQVKNARTRKPENVLTLKDSVLSSLNLH